MIEPALSAQCMDVDSLVRWCLLLHAHSCPVFTFIEHCMFVMIMLFMLRNLFVLVHVSCTCTRDCM